MCEGFIVLTLCVLERFLARMQYYTIVVLSCLLFLQIGLCYRSYLQANF